MKNALILALPLLALAACNEAADSTVNADETAMVSETENAMAMDNMATAGAVPAVASADYLAMAGASDMFEIESSKAVRATSSNAAIKSFAQMMVDGHMASTAKVKAAAAEAGMTVAPPKLSSAQQTMLDEIKAAPAAARDAIYMRHQATAHAEALSLHQGYASSGDAAPLKKAAGEIAPVVQTHIAELGKIKA